MFGLVEGKINQAVSEKKIEIFKLSNDRNSIVSRKCDLEELVEDYIEIESSVKGGLFFLVTGGLIITAINILNIPVWLSGLPLVLSGMGFLGELVNIGNARKQISISGNKDSKKVLLSKISVLDEELNLLRNKIKVKQNSINEYSKMSKDIDTLKNYQMSLGTDENKIKKACNYFYNKPQLVFDDGSEYDNYLKCDDDTIKKEMISSKILTK